jgi:aldehyde dehydrogenase (NAD+)
MTSVADIFKSMEYGPAPEADQPARQWLGKYEKVFGHFINGEWTEPGETFDVINPANREVIARVTQGTKTDVNAAVAAARSALPAWQSLDGHARARYLYAIARGIQKHSRLFAVVESMDNGKSIRETRDIDIPLVARHFYHHAGWAQLLHSEFPGYKGVGVVGQIIPWNFPLLMLAWKIAPALASGSTVVLKPAEFTPMTALLFSEVVREIGLPPGVLNIITGDGRTGAAIVDHPDIDKIAFTGSTDVGRIIRKATAGSGKKLSLELGGKSPFIVYDDADLDSVVEGVVDAIWFNQGQVCCAGSRLLVQEGVADRLIEKLRARMEKLRIGSPLDKAVDMGAIVAPVQLERIRTLVEQGKAEGATMWQPSWACPTDGYFYPPTLFTDVTPSSTIAQVEIFGPVLVSMTFRTPEESVALANNTPFGLAASIWTESINLALDIAPKLKSGVVWINSTNLFDASAGFGGYRESGFGREGGREGMWEYLKATRVTSRASRPGNRSTGSRKKLDVAFAEGRESRAENVLPAIDRTPKLFIGGKQARPDQGYTRRILAPDGAQVGEVPDGNRKDLRNAVEAAHGAWKSWGKATGHLRGQILYYIAENLSARADEFAARLSAMDGRGRRESVREVDTSIRRLFTYAAWADKWDGAVHNVPIRGVALAMHEPIGVMGIAASEEFPLLGFVSTFAPAIACGNTAVIVPSQNYPLAATDFYSVLETSDVPAGVVNIVTGDKNALARTLAEHDDVESIWYFGDRDGVKAVELASASNMKRTWASWEFRDWLDTEEGEGREFLREATQVKNIWVPYGE